MASILLKLKFLLHFDILGNKIKLVARCEHDAVAQGTSNEVLFLTTKALNEWDSR